MASLPFFTKSYTIKPFVLISMDGFGIAPPSRGNAVYLADTPNYDRYLVTYPHASLIASGESVGLPANEVGNSEVGHLTMGIGRVIYQSLERINHAIRDESIYQNPALVAAFEHAAKHQSVLHLMGMVGSGNVHSSVKHLLALLNMAKRRGFHQIVLHLFTDGRDSPPQEGKQIVEDILSHLQELGFGRIGTIAGRNFAMDRDGRWERVKPVYEAMTSGKGVVKQSPLQAIEETYAAGKSDEFVEPTVVVPSGQQPALIKDNDAVIFYNFRVDRARELTMAFTLSDFENLAGKQFGFDPAQAGGGQASGVTTFTREVKPQNLFFATMTKYQENLPVSAVAFPPIDTIANSLPELVSRQGWKQFHLAESEKERMVTYYVDGMRSERFAGEEVEILPSPKVGTYDLKPEMSARGIVKAFKRALGRDEYHFVMVNFANPDMVAHTGNLQATIKAIEVTDWAIGEVVKETLAHGGMAFITADHGNAEELITFPTGNFFYTSDEGTVNTDHSNNPIPFIIAAEEFAGKPVDLGQGAMSDIAPTIVALMGLPKPAEMTGRNLMEQFVVQKSV